MEQRLAALLERLAQARVDAALLTHPRDVLYYAGTARPATLLAGPRQAVLYVRRGLEWARREATVERVEPGGGWGGVVAALGEQVPGGGRLGVTLDVLSAQLYLRLGEAFPRWTLVDISELVLAQRMVKDADELEATRQAAAIADAGHAALAEALRPGVSELELATVVEAALRQAGHEGYQPLRHPHARGGGVFLMSGENLTVRGGHGLVVTGAGLSAASPYGASRRRVEAGDLVVLDIGATSMGYTADESRTYVVGPATAAQRALFDAALAVEAAVLGALRPGTPVADVYAAAETALARGASPFFAPGELALPGFVGHGIGLELDEPPVLWPRQDGPILAGMVLAVEIEVGAPAAGLMVKVEDSAVVGDDGARWLTAAPRYLIEVC
jgi:Xaa-Pro dipeptidase